jgi:hypothetical protein
LEGFEVATEVADSFGAATGAVVCFLIGVEVEEPELAFDTVEGVGVAGRRKYSRYAGWRFPSALRE